MKKNSGILLGISFVLIGCGKVEKEQEVAVLVAEETVKPVEVKEAPAPMPAEAARPKEVEKAGGKVFRLDLSEAELGSEPGGLFVVDGVFLAAESGQGVVLEMRAEPLVEGLVLLGEPMGGGAVIRAKVRASKRGRSYPRFGVGLHGISGYRMRVVPAQESIEIIKDDEVVMKEAYLWADEVAMWLEMKVAPRGEGDKWRVEGWVWPENGARPKEPQLVLDVEGGRYSGKGVLSATPYAGTPVQFAEVIILAEENDAEER